MNITVDSLPAAEQAATARERELLEAREALARAERIEHTAHDAHARAVELRAASEVEHARLKNMAELCEAVGGTVTWAKGEFSCAPLPK